MGNNSSTQDPKNETGDAKTGPVTGGGGGAGHGAEGGKGGKGGGGGSAFAEGSGAVETGATEQNNDNKTDQSAYLEGNKSAASADLAVDQAQNAQVQADQTAANNGDSRIAAKTSGAESFDASTGKTVNTGDNCLFLQIGNTNTLHGNTFDGSVASTADSHQRFDPLLRSCPVQQSHDGKVTNAPKISQHNASTNAPQNATDQKGSAESGPVSSGAGGTAHAAAGGAGGVGGGGGSGHGGNGGSAEASASSGGIGSHFKGGQTDQKGGVKVAIDVDAANAGVAAPKSRDPLANPS
jgi:hypothetical protein